MLLFEINHPAHIHLFRNLSTALLERGIPSVFLVKADPVIEHLAGFYDLPVIRMGRKGKGLLQKYLFQLFYLLKTIWIVRKFKITLGLGVSMNLPLVSKFTKMKSIGFDDDDIKATPVFARYANRATVILTPSALAHENRGDHHITYPGYHELAYLHPDRFSPDASVLEILGVKQEEKWFVVRFNAFSAHHDVGEEGMTFEQKKQVVEKLKEKGKVFISSESAIDPAFMDHQLPDRPELMHSILAFASLYVGESQTMTSEAAVLGTPALKCNTFAGRLSVPDEMEEKYGLCYSYQPKEFGKMMGKIDELLTMPDLGEEWQKRREKMLEDRIDVTGFFMEMVMDRMRW